MDTRFTYITSDINLECRGFMSWANGETFGHACEVLEIVTPYNVNEG